MTIGRRRSHDGTPPSVISAAMIRDAFNLPDDAVLIASVPSGTDNIAPFEVTTLTVGERTPVQGIPVDIPGNFLG